MKKCKILLDNILSYRNQTVILCYMRKHDVSIETARKHFRAMLAFLYFCATSENTFTPSEKPDVMFKSRQKFVLDHD